MPAQSRRIENARAPLSELAPRSASAADWFAARAAEAPPETFVVLADRESWTSAVIKADFGLAFFTWRASGFESKFDPRPGFDISETFDETFVKSPGERGLSFAGHLFWTIVLRRDVDRSKLP